MCFSASGTHLCLLTEVEGQVVAMDAEEAGHPWQQRKKRGAYLHISQAADQ